MLRQRCPYISGMAKIGRHRPSGIKYWSVLNVSIIDMRPEIIFLHSLGWLLGHHKNLSNPQLNCKETKRHKNANKNEKTHKNKKEAGKKPRKLQD